MDKVCVVGLGYIGLPTAVLIASKGYKVTGVDINKDLVKNINKGITHLNEPELDTRLSKVIKNCNLLAQIKPSFSDVFVIAVPTPYIIEKSGICKADTSFLFDAVKSICPFLKKGNLVIIESTSPVGTTEKIAEFIKIYSKVNLQDLLISYCPERVLPGKILKELIQNDRVIGGLNSESSEKTKNFYSTFCKGELHLTNSRTAEMVKLSENAFRDINIAFANEISMVCDRFDINTKTLIKLSNYHPRVNILNPGCGVGGHCIAVDPWFIASEAKDITPLIQTARKVNKNKTEWVISQIKSKIKSHKKNSKKIIVGCLGLSFKPNVEDLRESPALQIVENLIDSKFRLLVAEPNIKNYKNIVIKDYAKVLKEADLVFILVSHKEFESITIDNKKIFNFSN